MTGEAEAETEKEERNGRQTKQSRGRLASL